MAEELVTEIERDLAKLLAVEPSPEFRPRVRARIEAPRATRRGWWWALAASAAIAVVAVGVMVLRSPEGPGAMPPASSRGAAADVRLANIPTPPPVTARSVAVRPAPPRVRAAAANAPEVIVDTAQAEAVRRLLELARRAPRDTQVTLPAAAATSELSPIPLAPMVVDPLGVPELKTESKGVER